MNMPINIQRVPTPLTLEQAQERAAKERLSLKAHAAAVEFIDLRDRKTNPEGTFDNGGRFCLATKYVCCVGIRTPSRAFPFSQMVHGRTAGHVAHKHQVDPAEVRAWARLIDRCPEMRDSANAASAIPAVADRRIHRLLSREAA